LRILAHHMKVVILTKRYNQIDTMRYLSQLCVRGDDISAKFAHQLGFGYN